MTDLPDILELDLVGDHRYRVRQPPEPPEGRNVVFSGQLLAQTIMASEREAGGAKDVRSVHTIFARAGTYDHPLELEVDRIQAGRTWGSDTVTASQEGRTLARSLVLLNTIDPDLMRHAPRMPEAPRPEELDGAAGQVFPGAEWRPVPVEEDHSGVPVEMAWHRHCAPLTSPAANQGVVAWATCGNVIGLSMRPHRDKVRISDAHRTLSTGVIAQTIHFFERLDASQWLLVVTEGTQAGAGRVYGTGSVFTEDGLLVASFHQDSMAKTREEAADPRTAM